MKKNCIILACKTGLLLGIYFLFSCGRKGIPTDNSDFIKLNFEPIQVIKIHESFIGSGPCEPSISINPENLNQIVAGSVLDNVYVSLDAGYTWKKDKLKSSFGIYGDPVVRFNNKGDVFYAHLSNPSGKAYSSVEFLDRIVVQSSSDIGKTWSDGSFPPVDHLKDQDKPWMAIDYMSGDILMAWTEFDKYASKSRSDKSRILFSTSNDNGKTWTKSMRISDIEGDCLDNDKTTEGAHPAVGIDGTYYLVWGFDGKIYLDLSKDKGKTWLGEDIRLAEQMGGWAFEIPGIGRCNGMPVMSCDHSQGKNRGNLYVSWSDQRNGAHDTDIWIISSSDHAKTWSSPVRINSDGTGRHQFFSWMDVDQSTGYIYIVFYDRRNYNDNQTDVYLAYSTNGGRNFENIKISEIPFLPEPNVFFGDYNDISVRNGKIRPIWTRLDNGRLCVQTAIIDVK